MHGGTPADRGGTYHARRHAVYRVPAHLPRAATQAMPAGTRKARRHASRTAARVTHGGTPADRGGTRYARGHAAYRLPAHPPPAATHPMPAGTRNARRHGSCTAARPLIVVARITHGGTRYIACPRICHVPRHTPCLPARADRDGTRYARRHARRSWRHSLRTRARGISRARASATCRDTPALRTPSLVEPVETPRRARATRAARSAASAPR
jgi:hypothetical protein